MRIESTAEPFGLNVRGYAGSPERLKAATGWAAERSLTDSLSDVFAAHGGTLADRCRN